MILHWTPFDSALYHQSMKLRETVLRHPLGMQFTEEDLAIEQHQNIGYLFLAATDHGWSFPS